jgi:hypothetical protein
MRWSRIAMVLVGCAAMGWGGWLLVPLVTAGPRDAVSVAVWLFGGPPLHDALLAPAVGLLGLGVAAAPARWRVPVAAGLVISGVLALLALPGLVKPSPGPPYPGLVDRNYPLGLAVALGTVWLGVAVIGVARELRYRRRQSSTPPDG